MDDGDSLLLRITTAAIRKPEPGPSPEFSSREGENQEGPKTWGGGHIFKILCWMYAATGGSYVKWGSTDFKWGSRAPLALPLAQAASVKSFTLRHEATIENMTHHDHSSLPPVTIHSNVCHLTSVSRDLHFTRHAHDSRGNQVATLQLLHPLLFTTNHADRTFFSIKVAPGMAFISWSQTPGLD